MNHQPPEGTTHLGKTGNTPFQIRGDLVYFYRKDINRWDYTGYRVEDYTEDAFKPYNKEDSMSDFTKFSQAVHARYSVIAQHELFTVNLSGDELYAAYLAAFPEGTNPIYRERTEHDCSCCRNFIKNLGGVVAIQNGEVLTVWDGVVTEYPYDVVSAAMSELVKNAQIAGLFRTKEMKYGAQVTYELIEGQSKAWNHFHGVITSKHYHKTPGQACGDFNTAAAVFKRGLTELNSGAFDTVIDLIVGNALYRGEEHLPALNAFQAVQSQYLALTTERQRELFVWENASKPVARFRNTVIGTLIQDLSEGKDLEAAVKSFETKVAPTNYKRTTALITPGMVKEAMKTINELGLESALERRFATIHDISINNVLWVDNDAKGQMKGGIEGLLMQAAKPKKTAKSGQQTMGIEDFMADVVPKAKGMAVLFKGHHQANLMSLTAPVHADAAQLFKWANGFGWSYNGNVTDSIKDKVKRAGGNTDAKLRVSLGWFNKDDLDIHASCPDGHIYFGNKSGILDVDMNAWGPSSETEPVENLSWTRPKNGTYRITVNQYNQRTTVRPGCVLELECNGAIHQFKHERGMTGQTEAIEFVYKDGSITSLTVFNGFEGGGISQEKWNLHTEQYAKVSTLMFSPNHWDDQAVGNKHWFFILEGCRNDELTRGIYNEYLKGDLDKHRKVFEVLGSKTMCQPAAEQLSGLGFSSTRAETLDVQVTFEDGTRNITIQF